MTAPFDVPLVRDDDVDNRAAEAADRNARRCPTATVDWRPAWRHVLKSNGEHVDGLCFDLGCSLVLHGAWDFDDRMVEDIGADHGRRLGDLMDAFGLVVRVSPR